ncbi:hypothetical protein D4764_10G0010180 [Takifugu flavidus]|uniref:Uncharacterized protein n=1 Tax=Takifugu flavidus TaxID=433684 RepID=A0A5C6PMN9_9TELE|nr:hypothetical protein D4764_10G0010180 [Takifugu flavidus]
MHLSGGERPSIFLSSSPSSSSFTRLQQRPCYIKNTYICSKLAGQIGGHDDRAVAASTTWGPQLQVHQQEAQTSISCSSQVWREVTGLRRLCGLGTNGCPSDVCLYPHVLVNQWINKWANQSVNQWINQWANQSVNQWVNQSVNQWVNQWANQSVNQSVNQWANQWANQ